MHTISLISHADTHAPMRARTHTHTQKERHAQAHSAWWDAFVCVSPGRLLTYAGDVLESPSSCLLFSISVVFLSGLLWDGV